MARSPNHGSWHNQSRHDALHDHFATYSNSCIVEQEGSLSRTCHLDLPNQTKDLTPIQFTYSNFDALPNTSASTIDIQAWIQEFFFIGHGITVPENAIRKVTWDGADLWKIDVRSQGIAILDMIRWGFELEHAELFCEEVETWRERESGYVWQAERETSSLLKTIRNGLLNVVAFVAAVAIVSFGYVMGMQLSKA